MSLAVYPSKPIPRVGSSRKIIAPSYRSKSEGGYTYSRRKFTRTKQSYALNYTSINKAELEILSNFFKAHSGAKFYFTHPLENQQKECVFAMDELDITDLGCGLFNTKIELLEV